MAQTGIQFFNDRQSSVQVNVKSRKSYDRGMKNKIEFKILKMNLTKPMPGQEKSNMMTCELDLSQHLFNRFKHSSKASDFQTLLSQTMSLTSPKDGRMPGAVVRHKWREINQVRLNLAEQDNI